MKDLVIDKIPFTEQVVKRTLRHLLRIRKVGIYVMDVQARNYVSDLLVDFSIAMIEPHYLFIIKRS